MFKRHSIYLYYFSYLQIYFFPPYSPPSLGRFISLFNAGFTLRMLFLVSRTRSMPSVIQKVRFGRQGSKLALTKLSGFNSSHLSIYALNSLELVQFSRTSFPERDVCLLEQSFLCYCNHTRENLTDSKIVIPPPAARKCFKILFV